MWYRKLAPLLAVLLVLAALGGCGRAPAGRALADREESAGQEKLPEPEDPDGDEGKEEQEEALEETAAPSPLEGLHVGICYTYRDGWSEAAREDLIREGVERGCVVDIIDTEESAEEQVNALAHLIAQRVDLLVVSPVEDQNAILPLLEEAVAYDIPVVLLDRPLDADSLLEDYILSVCSDPVLEAQGTVEMLVTAGIPFEFVVELCNPASTYSWDCMLAFREAIEDFAGFPVLTLEIYSGSAVQAMEAMEDFIVTLADMEAAISFAVVAQDSEMARGAIDALQAAGLPLDEDGALVLCGRLLPDDFELIESGALYGAVMQSPLPGEAVFDALERLCTGESAPVPGNQRDDGVHLIINFVLPDIKARWLGQ